MRLPSFLATPAPTVARPDRAALRVGGRRSPATAATPVDRGARASSRCRPARSPPSLNGPAIADRQAVGAGGVAACSAALGGRVRRVALVVPDSIAKVSLVRLESVPARAQDLDQLIRWHVRKSAPFPIEEAQVTYSPGAPAPDGGREFVVALARRDGRASSSRGSAPRRARTPAWWTCRRFSLVNAVLAYAGAARRATGSWCTSPPTTAAS